MSIALDYATTPEAFCAALKRVREQRGITLTAIAQSTKISESHLAALERADLRHWPKGIFRRAFFRDYANAIGIEPEYLDKFRRLFPDERGETVRGCEGVTVRGCEGATVREGDQGHGSGDAGLRLVLEAEAGGLRLSGWRRGLVFVLDAVIAFALHCKARLGAPRALPERHSAPTSVPGHVTPPATWMSDARRIPDAHPQMRVRMRVVR